MEHFVNRCVFFSPGAAVYCPVCQVHQQLVVRLELVLIQTFLFETWEQILNCVFFWNMILLSCKMILLCGLSLCQVEQFQVQLLLNADDRYL